MSVIPANRSPSHPENLNRAYWDRVAARIERRRSPAGDLVGEVKRRAYLEMLDRWQRPLKGGWVLKTDLYDEAAGRGAFLADLSAGDGRVVGMDISFEAVARALDRTAPGHAAFVVADVRRLPFKPGSLARVVSPSTLDHFPDPEDLHRSLARIAGCLRPGGDLIVTLDNRQNVTDFLLRWARRLGRLPFYLGRSFTVRELERSVRRAGLRPADRTALVHHPRLMAALPARLLDRLQSPGLIRLFARVLLWMQRLERSPWQYWTGCFVAVRAVRPGGPSQEGQGRERWKRKKAPVSGA